MARVLIVSSRDLAPILGDTILWHPGVERLVASSPAGAFEVVRSFVPSLVVIDGCDAKAASEIVHFFRESPGTRRSSIVLVDPAPEIGDQELLGAGANLVLRGPVDPTHWDDGLKRLLAIPRRVRAGLPARIVPRTGKDAPGELLQGLALDVSLGGVLLETAGALPEPGRLLDIFLTLPDHPEELHAPGKVVWAAIGPPPRIGVQLVRLEDEARDRLRRMLASAPDRAFGRYEVIELIGEGSMGRVYRGFDPLARRPVAIKCPKPEFLNAPESPEYLRRFRREAQAAARLDHVNVITIYDVGDDYFVMELLEGTTLQAILREKKRLEPDEVRRILGPVAEALDYAHTQGTVHRDIKPSNIMVLADGRPKVMDFGVAHLSSAPALTSEDRIVGSPAYMAPEQIEQSEATPATDRFSLAVVAYEALTGRKPFEGGGVTPVLYRVVHSAARPPTSLNPALPTAYDDIFLRALAKEPAGRFESAQAFVNALAQSQPAVMLRKLEPVVADTVDLRSPPSPERTAPFRWGRRRLWAGAAALAAGLGLIVLGPLFRASWWGPRVIPPPPGLQISTTPAGAAVLLEGVEVGKSPLFLTNLSPGLHVVKVVHEGFTPAELGVETSKGAPPVPLRFTLQPLTGNLKVESSPDAEVEIDGRPVGATPLPGQQVLVGLHRVVVRRAGFRPWIQTVDVRPGESIRLDARLSAVRGPGGTEDALRKSWVRVGDLVALGPGVTPPRRVAGEPAPYPETARRMRLKGSVTVELTVTETGDVIDPRVVESAGEVLDEALVTAVKSWHYEPADVNGVKVRVRFKERQTFG